MRNTIIFFMICIGFSCKNNSQKQQLNVINDSVYKYELDKHPGTKSYEILHPTRYGRIVNFLFNTIVKRLVVNNDIDYLLLTSQGSFIDSIENIGYPMSKTGVIGGIEDGMSDFLLTGKKKFKPIKIEDIDSGKKAFEIYDKMYHKADVYVKAGGLTFPCFRIDGEWINPSTNNDELNAFLLSKEGRAKYPEKPITNRFKVIDPFGPQLSVPPDRRDTSVFKIVDYMPAVVEKERWGMNTHTYSAGYYQVEIYMPGGDTIHFRRASAMGVNIDMYRLPKEYGGRQDILFLNLDPPGDANLKDGCSGLYVIRPRDLSAPEKRYTR